MNPGVWELKFAKPITRLNRGNVTVRVKDRQGNVSRIERTFSVGDAPALPARVSESSSK